MNGAGSELGIINGIVILGLLFKLFLVPLIKNRNRKKTEESSGNPGYGERIGKLETKVEEMDKDNEKDHKLIREDIRKIFNLINGMKK